MQKYTLKHKSQEKNEICLNFYLGTSKNLIVIANHEERNGKQSYPDPVGMSTTRDDYVM